MNMTNRTNVQEEIMRIVQEQQQQQQNGGEGGRVQKYDDEEEYENTGDYSILSNLEATTMTDDYSILLHEGGSAGVAGTAVAKNDDGQGEGLLLLHDLVVAVVMIQKMIAAITVKQHNNQPRFQYIHKWWWW
jgi:hypothetical protein